MKGRKDVFKHQLVKPFELSSIEDNDKRYYLCPDGTKLKSVTTVLGEKLDKSGLVEWRKRVGEEEANRVVKTATRRGSAVHKLCEQYLMNEDILRGGFKSKVNPLHFEAFYRIRPILDHSVQEIWGIELPLYSKTLKAAGRTDLACIWDGIPTIVDFKTANKEKKEDWIISYFLQSTCYSMMFDRLYNVQVPQIVIIIVNDEGTVQVFKKERNDYVGKVLDIFCG